jgi:hypothetical protein
VYSQLSAAVPDVFDLRIMFPVGRISIKPFTDSCVFFRGTFVQQELDQYVVCYAHSI